MLVIAVLANAPTPIVSSWLFGAKVTWFNKVQLKNALVSISLTVAGIVTLTIIAFEEKALLSINVTGKYGKAVCKR